MNCIRDWYEENKLFRKSQTSQVIRVLNDMCPDGFSWIDEEGNTPYDRPVITATPHRCERPYDYYVNRVFKENDTWKAVLEDVDDSTCEYTVLLDSNEIALGHIGYILDELPDFL